MLEVVVQIHFYNMVLVMIAGIVTGIWGLVLFFRERRTPTSSPNTKLGVVPRFYDFFAAWATRFLRRGQQPRQHKTARPAQNVGNSPEQGHMSAEGKEREKRAADLPKRKLYRPWRISLIVTAILAALQALLGITLVLLGQQPPGGSLYYLHYVYGAIVALALPVAVSYATGSKNLRRDIVTYSIAALILVAAGARALMTGLGMP